jgi:hypothetical protein
MILIAQKGDYEDLDMKRSSGHIDIPHHLKQELSVILLLKLRCDLLISNW